MITEPPEQWLAGRLKRKFAQRLPFQCSTSELPPTAHTSWGEEADTPK
jgi:hypothetical protein